MKLRPIVNRLTLLAIWLAPFVALELGLQFIYRHDLSRRSWAWAWMLSPSVVAQTAPANTDQVFDSRWAGSAEQLPRRGSVRFRTDRYGSIVPSALTAALEAPRHPYVVFCGGSTTESAVVSEGHRPADVFARLRDVPAVNVGRSGKSIDGCMASLRDLLSLQLPRPGLIVVANNVNTLMGFAQEQLMLQPSDSHGAEMSAAPAAAASKPLALQSRVRNVFPGILHAALKFKVASGPYAEMEYGLKAGCCHGASEVNRHGPNFDWRANVMQERYRAYAEQRSMQLRALLAEVEFPESRLVIFIEPNSFALPSITSGPDYRQRLRNFDGSLMSLPESARVTAVYDRIYATAFRAQGFAVLQLPQTTLGSDYFYDAVHLTAQGARGVGAFYAEKLP